MFLIVEKLQDGNNHVVLGPMNWRPTYFTDTLMDDLDIDFKVPMSNQDNEVIIVSDTVKILPVTDLGVVGEYNPKIQFTSGPFYNYFDDQAQVYYTPTDKPVDTVKIELKSIVASNRYVYENIGITANVQNTQVTLLTSRGNRDLYLQAYQLGSDNVNWKFGDLFLTLTNSDLGNIVSLVSSHVQATFDWEKNKGDEIDSKNTLSDLNSVILISDNPAWQPPSPNIGKDSFNGLN